MLRVGSPTVRRVRLALQSDGTPEADPLPDPPVPYWEAFEPVAEPLLAFAVVYLLGRFLLEPSVERIIRLRNPNNRTVLRAASRYVRTVVTLVALAATVAAAGYGDVLARSSILLAAVTVALGVAGQAVIGNVVSGVFLVADGEFNVGDWIAWADYEGVVEDVGFRVTRVRTPDNETVTVPNTELATDAVVRPYSRDRYRVSEEFEVAAADIGEARELVHETLVNRHETLADPAPSVRLVDLTGGVHLRAEYWIPDPSRRNVNAARDAVTRAVVERLLDAGVEVNPPAGHELSGAVDVRGREE